MKAIVVLSSEIEYRYILSSCKLWFEVIDLIANFFFNQQILSGKQLNIKERYITRLTSWQSPPPRWWVVVP